MSIAICEFERLAIEHPITVMQTAAETRRARLEILIARHGGIAELNEALQWPRTDPKLSQIRNANTRPGRAKPYQMGDAMAREIEEKLSLERGWMDTPPSYLDIHGESDQRSKVMLLMERLPDDQLAVAARLLDALAEHPDKKNGTTGA
ncbi:MAG: hypothetical protein AB7I35_01430 [Ramlibacter sp.]